MSSNRPRALVGARVSVLSGPQKVSHEAQIDTATKWAKAHDYPVVGAFEDVGVSASVPPDERPELGPWIRERSHEWEVIIWSKLDRGFRSMRHCSDFIKWAEMNHKIVVFADDGLTLNYLNPASLVESTLSELFVSMAAAFAQIELNRFKSRAEDMHRAIRPTTRWAAGLPPLGYRVVDHPSGRGKGLAIDPDAANLVREMADKLVDGWSFVRITEWLNESGKLTSQGRSRKARGLEPKGRWTTTNVIEILTGYRTLGIKTHKDQPVLDNNGEPIRLAPPLFTPERWDEVQRAAQLRKGKARTPSDTSNPMLEVGFCAVCGSSLAQQFSKTKPRKSDGHVTRYRYYRCSRTPINCKTVFVVADILDELLSEQFLLERGDRRVTERVFIAGEDNSYELDFIKQRIELLREDRASGLFPSGEDELVYRNQMKQLLARRDELASAPVRQPGYENVELEKTYREVWPSATPEEKRKMLIDAEISIRLGKSPGKSLRAELVIGAPY
ncbi:recombinase family protein [Mycobacteroides chelonae]|uniref:recombinase family protein n=1 Tax=Mycobacteroides chelonae TaxID=1774 RepID=UPI00099459A3|nr:recombinase family protein [Mycobacteroides chelonae]WED94034.1 recombinase family protein [Mycobacteroides chelonae]WED98143.1 recombinase family protein [Mycobacteroides chelonae]